MKYTMQPHKRHWPKRLFILAAIIIVVAVLATIYVRHVYNENLKPVNSSTVSQKVTIQQGASVNQIASLLQDKGLIRSAWVFKLYVSSKEVRSALQAGTYSLEPSQSLPEIVGQLTHGKIATTQVTILPGQRLDQIRDRLIKDGFSASDVATALDANQYKNNPALVDKPDGASLEGYLYPDTFQQANTSDAKSVVEQSLQEMQDHLTPDLRSAFAKQGLSTYQGIILASIVESEVSRTADRAQAAQVFLKRLQQDMALGSDVTAYYGSLLAGQGQSVKYDSPYNTLLHKGLPPTPISNVSDSSLNAVAHPASTDWLYFVTGDDGVTHFSKTLQDHEALTQQYCHKLCAQ